MFMFSLSVFIFSSIYGFVTVHFEVCQHAIDSRKLHLSIIVSNWPDFDVLMMYVSTRGNNVEIQISCVYLKPTRHMGAAFGSFGSTLANVHQPRGLYTPKILDASACAKTIQVQCGPGTLPRPNLHIFLSVSIISGVPNLKFAVPPVPGSPSLIYIASTHRRTFYGAATNS